MLIQHPTKNRSTPTSLSTASARVLTLLLGLSWLSAQALAEHTPHPSPLGALRDLQSEYQIDLAELADQLADTGDPQTVDQIRGWAIPPARNRDWLYLPPKDSTDVTTEPKPSTSNEFLERQKQQADRLWNLAHHAADNKQVSRAVQLAHLTLREDPHHAAARKLLSVDRRQPSIKTGQGKTQSKKYGWPAGQYRWVRSTHFQLLTNCDEPTALALIGELETFHAIWRQLFAEFSMTEKAFGRGWQRGVLPSRSTAKHRVVLFANQDEYVSQLRRWEPRIAVSEGFYDYRQRTAFFFAKTPFSLATVRHEVTHQLFHEAPIYQDVKGAGGNVGESQDFWVVEGIAMYMESLRPRSGLYTGCFTVGGPDSDRLQYARNWALSAQQYTPLATLNMMGREALQSDPDIRQLYSQANGLAHFFMSGREGRYRQAFREYLRDVYDKHHSEKSLAQRLNVSFPELDQQYADFLTLSDAELDDLDANVIRLSLGNTQVTDVGIQQLRDLQKLLWLDLSATAVTDDALADIAQLEQLETLWLANTTISDESIPHLQALSNLTELDLRGTHVTQQGRRRLRATLPRLKTLVPAD